MAFTREQIEEELFYILSESYCFNEEQTIEDIRASSSLIQDLGMDSIQVDVYKRQTVYGLFPKDSFRM